MTPYYADNAVTLYHGDCREIVPTLGRFDLLLTDPPYSYDFIDCWSTLSDIGYSYLKTGGFCLVYSGQTYLPEVMQRLGKKLTYCWVNILLHTGATQAIHHRHTMCGYKPILVYSNGKPVFPLNGYARDIIKGSGRSKVAHPWEQSVLEQSQMICHYTEVGMSILDPFAGSGTTGRAAKDLGRKAVLIEREERYCEIAARRMAQEVLPLYEVTP